MSGALSLVLSRAGPELCRGIEELSKGRNCALVAIQAHVDYLVSLV